MGRSGGAAPAPLAVVTGAASPGIGVAVTEQLLKGGWRIHGSYEQQDGEAAREIAGRRLTLTETDHADPDALAAFLAATPAGPVGAVVCAAWHFAMEDPGKLDLDVWDRVMRVNLTAPYIVFHALRDRLGPGSGFVMVTSAEALRGSYGAPAYTAAKAGVHSLTMSLANIAGSQGPRVNAVAAGWISDLMDTDKVLASSSRLTPLGRLGAPREVAEAVMWLLSRSSSYVNGTVLPVDGGYHGTDPVAQHEFRSAFPA